MTLPISPELVMASGLFGLDLCQSRGGRDVQAGLPPGGWSSDSATMRIRNSGRLEPSRSSICHSEFCWSLREMPPTMSPQTEVSSFQAALWSASSVPWSSVPE